MTDDITEETTKREIAEARVNLDRSSTIILSREAGGINSQIDWAQAFEIAKYMARSGPMVAEFLRGSPWACLGIYVQAFEWNMSPWRVAQMAYLVESRKTGQQMVSYPSQLIHALIEARAPITDRLSHRFDGSDDGLTCTVWTTLRNKDGTPGRVIEYTSPTLGERKKALRIKISVDADGEVATVKGSPLWTQKPKVQLYYDTSRDWARMFFPDILMGIYSKDELEDQEGWAEAKKISDTTTEPDSGFTRRLTSQAISRAGFDLKGVEEEAERIKN